MRSALRRQPLSPASGDSLQPAPHRPGNPSISRIRLCLQTPDLPISGAKLPKVSGPFRENSRFAENIGRDRFDHDCRPRVSSILRALIRFRSKLISRGQRPAVRGMSIYGLSVFEADVRLSSVNFGRNACGFGLYLSFPSSSRTSGHIGHLSRLGH